MLGVGVEGRRDLIRHRYRDDRRRRRNAEGASEVDQRRVGRQPGARERRETDESERRIPRLGVIHEHATVMHRENTRGALSTEVVQQSGAAPRLAVTIEHDPRERHFEGGQHHRRPSLLAVAPSPARQGVAVGSGRRRRRTLMAWPVPNSL